MIEFSILHQWKMYLKLATCGWKKPFSSKWILTVLIFFFDIFSRKIFENQEVIYEDDVTSLYLACLTHSVLIFWFAFSQRISVDGKKRKKKSETTIESRNHETIERFTKINVICIGILSSDLQLVLPVKKKEWWIYM